MSSKIVERLYNDISCFSFGIENREQILDNGGKYLNHTVYNLISNKSFGLDLDRYDYIMWDCYHYN